VQAWRLEQQYLAQRVDRHHAVQAVERVLGVQAQVMSAAELAIGARVAGVTQQDVQAALWQEHTLVKTYGPRGTLHLLPADELPLWMAAMSEAEALSGQRWYERAGLDAVQGAALLDAIGAALDGLCLTRRELADAVVGEVGDWAQERLLSAWGEFLSPAALAGKLCFGPSAGSQVRFVRADQWIGHWEEHEPRAALVELCRRYIATHGPVTHGDVAHWFRLKPAQARALIEPLAPQLEEVDFLGRRAWLLADDAQDERATGESLPDSLHLLPQYDCYLLGCAPRERIVPEVARPRVNSYGRGRFEGATALPTLLITGSVAGIWERRTQGRKAAAGGELRVETFTPLTTRQRERLDAEAARMGAFLGMNLTLALGALGE
jgi:hypothetical protein